MKQKRAFVKRMLTFVLCMALVFTSVNAPVMTVMAAEDVTDSETAVSGNDTEVVETTVEETTETTEETAVEESTEAVEETAEETEEETIEETIVEETVEETTEEVEETTFVDTVSSNSVSENNPGTDTDVTDLAAGYSEIFFDGFNGESLDTTNWTREVRPAGWTNQELQEYVDSEDNAYVANGNLVLQAIQNTDAEGNTTYTSGKIQTQNKVDFTYGKVEARLKVPSGGKGLWPAFWMMPTNEKFYGTWPKCGEIDIMEVLGHEPAKGYQTIHFGEPHKEDQGTLVLTEGTFASDYHIWAVEWLPGKMIFTIDGQVVNEINDWYTKAEGGDEVTFPAPFDQDFFLQFNLAVGGTWPGNPDENTKFGEDAQLLVDWVRVSQQSEEAYEELLANVEQPDRSVTLRDPDANGNYIVNGDFSVEEVLNETDAISAGADWVFLTAEGGTGTAAIDTAEGKITIDTTNASASEHNQTYAIQLVQPGLPMEQGKEYKLTFDAKADAARTMIVDISNTSTWSRYLADTTLDLTTDWTSYEYTFNVTAESDANARLEYNLGKQNSVDTVYIKNVKLVQTGNTVEIEDSATTPDGNYVRNGGFDVGEGRLAYWTVNTGETGASVSVTNVKDTTNNIYVRELKTVGAEGLVAADVTVTQSNLALLADTTYSFMMDAYAQKATTIKVIVAGTEYPVELTTENNRFLFDVTTPAELTNKDVVLCLGSDTTVFVDNISIKDQSLIINGSFDNGLSGWTPFKDSGVNGTSWEVIKDGTNNAVKYTISDTGAQDWMIQLKQHNVKLENGKTYKLTFKAKSDMERKLQFAFQRDGSIHKTESGGEDWTPYSNTEIVTLSGEDKVWQEFSTIFTMTEPTDETTILSITMGAVGGTQITQKHDIFLDDFVLEETEAPIELVTGEMIVNGDFAAGKEPWEDNCGQEWTQATASATYGEGGAVFTIDNVGFDNYCVQLKQLGLTLVNGQDYKIKLEVESDVERYIDYSCMDQGTAVWYGGASSKLETGKTNEIEFTFTMNEASDDNAYFLLSLGKNANEETTATGIVTVKSVSVQAVTGDETPDGPEAEQPVKGELIVNGDFASGQAPWEKVIGESWAEGSAGTATFGADGAVYDITAVGNSNWNVQLKQAGLALVNGYNYLVKVDLEVENTRDIEVGLLSASNDYYGGGVVRVEAGAVRTIEQVVKMEKATDNSAVFQLSMGNVGEVSPAGKVTVKSVSVKYIPDGLWIEKIAAQTYTGKKITPVVNVYDGGTKLTLGKDYKVEYGTNKNVGEGTVTVIGKGNYTSKDKVTFEIVEKSLASAGITVNESLNATINNKGKVTNPTITVKMGNTKLKEGRDYEVVWPTEEMTETVSGNGTTTTVVKPGHYTVTVKAVTDAAKKCNFSESVTIPYDVLANGTVQMSKVKVTLDPKSAVTYSASCNTTPVVKEVYAMVGGKKVVYEEGTQYKVTYPQTQTIGKNNIIKIEAVNEDCTNALYGTKEVKFEVKGAKLTAKNYAIVGVEKTYPYTGKAIEPVITVVDLKNKDADGNPIAIDPENYTVSYDKNVNAGKNAKVIVTGKGAYNGKLTKTFEITKTDLSVSTNTIVIEPIAAQTYTGKKITPAVTVTVNGVTLTEKKDYKVEYDSNKNVGMATVKVTGQGNYSKTGATAVASFEIVAKSLASADITVNESLNATINNKGKVTNPTITVKMGNTKLKVGRDYEVVWPTEEMTETVSGNGTTTTVVKPGHYTVTVKAVTDSDKKCNFSENVTIPYDVLAKGTVQMSKVKVTLDPKSAVTYSASCNTTPVVKEVYAMVGGKKVVYEEGTQYKVTYPQTQTIGKNNIIKIEAVNEDCTNALYGTKEVKFEVKGTKLTAKNYAIVGVEKTYPYTGKAIEPVITVVDLKNKDADGNPIAIDPENYTVSYDKNVNGGKNAKVIVTGKGAYTGKLTKTFEIEKESMSFTEILANLLSNLF